MECVPANEPKRGGDLFLSEINTSLALISYPAIVILVFNWWGAGARWASENKSFFMPPDLRIKAERTGRFLFFFK
jgi:hypothetical protein